MLRSAFLTLLLCPILPAAPGLHPYCWGFLNAHPERAEIPDAQAQEIQKGHIAHLNRMASEGNLLAAGPLATPGGARGILVFRCTSAAEPDPAVLNKRLSIKMAAAVGRIPAETGQAHFPTR